MTTESPLQAHLAVQAAAKGTPVVFFGQDAVASVDCSGQITVMSGGQVLLLAAATDLWRIAFDQPTGVSQRHQRDGRVPRL
jgi:hypothetical protein